MKKVFYLIILLSTLISCNEGKSRKEYSYAKDIGVIKTERRFPCEQELRTMELSEVLTNREFELMLIRDK
ncbi:MAG: hypothetical protein ACI9N1_001173 [Flavobacteriales bacterium]|jgi:hypothetical protein